MADGRGQMAVSLGHDYKKTVVFSVRTSANGQIVKISKPKTFGVVDQFVKTIITLDHT